MPAAYRFSTPAGFVPFLLFAVSLILGMLIVISYSMISYLLLFFVVASDGIFWAFNVAGQFLGGQFIPLLFFPEQFQRVIYMLPFAYANDFPFRIYTGEYGLDFAYRGLAVQIVWLAALIVIGKAMTGFAVSRTVAQGG
jgi:ABC-2 type transport system permease protein